MESDEVDFLSPDMYTSQCHLGCDALEILINMNQERVEIEKCYADMLEKWSFKYSSKKENMDKFVYPELKTVLQMITEEAHMKASEHIEFVENISDGPGTPLQSIIALIRHWRNGGKNEQRIDNLIQTYTNTVQNYLGVFNDVKRACNNVSKSKKKLAEFERMSAKKHDRYKGRKDFERVMKNLFAKKTKIVYELSEAESILETLKKQEEVERDTFISSSNTIHNQMQNFENQRLNAIINQLTKFVKSIHDQEQHTAYGYSENSRKQHISEIKFKLEDLEPSLMFGKWEKSVSKTINFSKYTTGASKSKPEQREIRGDVQDGYYSNTSSGDDEDGSQNMHLQDIQFLDLEKLDVVRAKFKESRSDFMNGKGKNKPKRKDSNTPTKVINRSEKINGSIQGKIHRRPTVKEDLEDIEIDAALLQPKFSPLTGEGDLNSKMFKDLLDPVWFHQYNEDNIQGSIGNGEVAELGVDQCPTAGRLKQAWGNMDKLEVVTPKESADVTFVTQEECLLSDRYRQGFMRDNKGPSKSSLQILKYKF